MKAFFKWLWKLTDGFEPGYSRKPLKPPYRPKVKVYSQDTKI